MSDLFPSHDDIPDNLPEGVKGCLHLLTFLMHIGIIVFCVWLIYTMIFL
jgi:hypothetical protein